MTERFARSQIRSANALLEHCRWPLAAVVVIRVRIWLATTGGGKSRWSSTIGPGQTLSRIHNDNYDTQKMLSYRFASPPPRWRRCMRL